MVTLTIEIEEVILQRARERAEQEGTTVEEVVLRFLFEYSEPRPVVDVEKAMAFLADLRKRVSTAGQKFTREELNERGTH